MENKNISKKNKAGIVTFYHNNYNFGGLLQAYALPNVLKKHFGIDAEQIDYMPYMEKPEIKQCNKNLTQRFCQTIYNFGIAFFAAVHKNNLNKRKQAFDKFIDEIPHSETAYDYNTINESGSRYQLFLCGGDQIWNDYNEDKNIKVYTLQFAPSDTKKIAYAPSMAVMETTADYNRIMSAGLNGLDAVSVREKKSLPLLEKLTDKMINVVVDPVLLMTKQEWDSVAKPSEKNGKYILCYLLGDRAEPREAVKTLARKLRMPVLTFPHIVVNVVRKCDLFFGDIHDYTSGPREFIGLIKDAEFVITDSFHACVLCMIFEKPFAVLERNKAGEKGNMNSRIYDFLEEYHLENQLLTEKDLKNMQEISQIDFTYAHEHWAKRREESLEYLRNALKHNRD